MNVLGTSAQDLCRFISTPQLGRPLRWMPHGQTLPSQELSMGFGAPRWLPSAVFRHHRLDLGLELSFPSSSALWPPLPTSHSTPSPNSTFFLLRHPNWSEKVYPKGALALSHINRGSFSEIQQPFACSWRPFCSVLIHHLPKVAFPLCHLRTAATFSTCLVLTGRALHCCCLWGPGAGSSPITSVTLGKSLLPRVPDSPHL